MLEKSWRPRKATRANEQEPADDETNAWVPGGWTGMQNVDTGSFFFPPHYWPFEPGTPYYDAAYAWQNALLSDAET